MTDYEIYEYAVKGLYADIDKLEKDINRGKRLLLEYERGQKPTTSKTPQEIKEIIREKKAEIEVLDKKRFELTWKMSTEMKNEQ